METFGKLFASLLSFVYHCFDRVVIQGYLPLLTRAEHIVYFFHHVHGIYPITKQVLRQRTRDYQQWVETFARKRRIPIQWPDPEMKKKGLRQEDYARPYLQAMERRKRFGVYFIFKTMEPGPNFRSCPPKYPTGDPHYRGGSPQSRDHPPAPGLLDLGLGPPNFPRRIAPPSPCVVTIPSIRWSTVAISSSGATFPSTNYFSAPLN